MHSYLPLLVNDSVVERWRVLEVGEEARALECPGLGMEVRLIPQVAPDLLRLRVAHGIRSEQKSPTKTILGTRFNDVVAVAVDIMWHWT
jgi:hypothetical protein